MQSQRLELIQNEPVKIVIDGTIGRIENFGILRTTGFSNDSSIRAIMQVSREPHYSFSLLRQQKP
jgi:hypothetical protein